MVREKCDETKVNRFLSVKESTKDTSYHGENLNFGKSYSSAIIYNGLREEDLKRMKKHNKVKRML
jgi:hypothetical protein